MSDSDAYPNEVVVAGCLMAALWGLGGRFTVEPVTTNEVVTNELYVWPEFMRSRYRITITLDPEEGGDVR